MHNGACMFGRSNDYCMSCMADEITRATERYFCYLLSIRDPLNATKSWPTVDIRKLSEAEQ